MKALSRLRLKTGMRVVLLLFSMAAYGLSWGCLKENEVRSLSEQSMRQFEARDFENWIKAYTEDHVQVLPDGKVNNYDEFVRSAKSIMMQSEQMQLSMNLASWSCDSGKGTAEAVFRSKALFLLERNGRKVIQKQEFRQQSYLRREGSTWLIYRTEVSDMDVSFRRV